jgi:hypothetical protein
VSFPDIPESPTGAATRESPDESATPDKIDTIAEALRATGMHLEMRVA